MNGLIYFARSGVTFALTKRDEAESQPESHLTPVSRSDAEFGRPAAAATKPLRWNVKLDFLGANPGARLVAEDRTPAVISYFKGTRENWKAGLATYSKLVYKELWSGIDLGYSGNVNRLKYDFVIRPGARPEQIRLAYRGATSVSVNEMGELEVSTPAGNFQDVKPYAYQEIDGQQVEVTSSYNLDRATGEYGFRLGQYDRSRPLVLDPAVLVYAGYIGGSGDDVGLGIAVDAADNAYVTGFVDSIFTGSTPTFPVTVGPDLNFNGGTDAFVAKVNAAGTALIYAGYIGGSDKDSGTGIAVDAAGNAYITGNTNSTESTFPATVGPDLSFNGGTDAFVAKVNAEGTALIYAGYIGGSGKDAGTGIAVDAAGNAYITGTTNSTEASFPVNVGPEIKYNGGFEDAFVVKVNAAGTALVYAGYIGGSASDYGAAIAIDAAGNAYVTGTTSSTEATFPVTVGPDLTYNGGLVFGDAFVAKVNATGTALIYAGYIGGASDERGFGIAVDVAGNAYITGATSSTEASFPVTVGPNLTYNGGFEDAFVAKVNAAGTALVYAGYIGGSGEEGLSEEYGAGIAVDAAGNAYITGITDSGEASFPVAGGPDQSYNGGRADAFVAMVNAPGTALVYAGYIGGPGFDMGTAIGVDWAGNAYVTGQTTSSETTFPVTVGPALTFSGFRDAFVAKIMKSCTYAMSAGGQALPAGGGIGTINITTDPGCAWNISGGLDWVTFTGATSGVGSATIGFQTAPNAGGGRSGSITIGGLTFTVEQQAASIPGLNFIGSMAHIAAQENWTTAFTLVNKGAVPTQARISLFGDPSGTLTLPLEFPQTLTPLPLLAASIDRTLAANASLLIDTGGPQTPPVQIGSAQLGATDPVDGFAIFHHVVSAQEAVVPMETRNASSYLLAFDNTNGLVLGVAVENVSSQNAIIPVVIRDDTGVQISAPGATIPLGGNGHTAFVLSDPVQGFPVTANKRGTIEFDTPTGGQISVLGIRFTPLGPATRSPRFPRLPMSEPAAGASHIWLQAATAGKPRSCWSTREPARRQPLSVSSPMQQAVLCPCRYRFLSPATAPLRWWFPRTRNCWRQERHC